MKLIKLLEHWLDSYPINKQAEVLGLVYADYGRWKDSKTGKVVAKTIDGKIVRITGAGEDAMDSPAQDPDKFTAEPIAGDSVNGNSSNRSRQDANMDLSLPIDHVIRNPPIPK